MGEHLRILLVEDSEDDASLLLREIKKGGYEPTLVRVETAETMVRCLNEQTWDIVISNYSLPKFSAPEALKVLQKSELDLPFIIVSSKVDDEVAVAALTAGAHDFVRKDNLIGLIPAIKRELGEVIGRAEYEKAQIELKESESLLRAISANLPNSYISIIEEDFTIGFTSGKEFNNQNLNPESFVGLTLEEVFKEQAPVIKEHYLKAFDGVETSFELFINEQYQEYNVIPIFDENGEVHRILSVVENITERKRAEEALMESEEKYSSLFKNNYSIMLLIDPQTGNIVDANSSACVFYGYTQTELTQKKIYEINLLSDEEVQQEMNKAKLEQRNHFFFRHRLASGEIRDVEVYSAPITVQGKSLLYSIIHDITERKQAEEALRDSELKYRSLFENSIQGVAISQGNQSIDANKTLIEIFGYDDLEKFLAVPLMDHVAPESKELIMDRMEKRASGMLLPPAYEYKILRKDGEIRDLEISTSEFKIGEEKYIQGTFSDITERKQVEEVLKESEDKYRSLFEFMAQGVFYQSANGLMIDVNQAALNMLGLTRDQFLGRDSYDPAWNVISEDGSYLPPDKYPSMTALNTGKDVNDAVVGVFNPKINEYNWLNINAKPQFRDGEGKPYHVFVTLHDITKRKQAEEALQEREHRLLRAQEVLHVGDWENDLKTDRLTWSDELYRIYGFERADELKLETALAGIHPDDRNHVKETLAGWAENGEGEPFEYRVLRPDGSIRYVYSPTDVVCDSTGKVVKLYGVSLDVTERKQAEGILRLHSKMLENMGEGVYLIRTSDGIIVYANPRFEEMFGYEPGEMIGQHVSIVNAPTDISPEEKVRVLMKILMEEGAWHGDIQNIKKDGTPFWCHANVSVFEHSEYGQVLVAVHEDITKRKQTEEVLKKHALELELNKKRIDVLLQLTQMADNSLEEITDFVLNEGAKLTNSEFGFIGLINEDESILTATAWTKNVMNLCGVIDKPLRFNVDRAGVWVEPLRQRKSVIINDYESTEYNKNGVPDDHVPLLRLINIPIFEGDRIVALVAMANKEDEYTKTDAQQLKLLLKGMWSIIQRKHAEDEKDTLIHEISERTKELNVLYDISKLAAKTGITWENVMEQAITIIPTGWQYPEITCARIILNGNEYATSNFTKTMWRQISPIIISDELVGSVEVCYLEEMPKIDEGPFYHEERDLLNTVAKQLGSITERKKAEDEILRLNSELEQRVKDRTAELEQKNKELVRLDKVKTEFLDTVNHELRTPLTSIIGYSRLLLDGVQGEMTEKQTNYIERIWTRGNHQLQLVNDLLDFSKLESGNMDFMSKSVPVTAAINDTVHDEMPLLKEKGQEVILEIANDVADVYVDEMRLKQVMLNIVNNAIKFTPDNGKIVIKADNVDEMVKISVIDNGIGIKETDMEQLFKKFVQIDQSDSRSFGGTGLGLTIAKDMVELMGGHIDVESEYGKGSTFSIFLPQKKI